jgi:hypothetical protein
MVSLTVLYAQDAPLPEIQSDRNRGGGTKGRIQTLLPTHIAPKTLVDDSFVDCYENFLLLQCTRVFWL